jgi:lipopolysaccharide export system protein LptA
MNMRVEWFWVCLLLLATPALAEKADKLKPVNLEADSVRVEDAKKTAVYDQAQGSSDGVRGRVRAVILPKGVATGNASTQVIKP